MRNVRRLSPILRDRLGITAVITLALGAAAALVDGCSASNNNQFPGPGTGGQGGGAGTGAAATTTTSMPTGQGGSIITLTDGGSGDAKDEVAINPCGTECGPKELCDDAHLGLDDNCDGQVDESCACAAGQAHFCFKGDPSYRGTPGCYDGTMLCTEQGTWGPCVGGVHAIAPDLCYQNNTTNCHAITSPPGADVHLKTGTGNFSNNAVAGTETYTVKCPAGVSQCPGVMPPDDFKPLQSGEYTVTYTKKVAGDPNPQTCTFPLVIGAPGLRVELSWEHTTADDGVDLDLHVHQPNNTQPWGIDPPAVPQDCTWSTCVVDNFWPFPFGAPTWFADPPAMPPTPVNWYKDPVAANNTCYSDPHGVGDQWANTGLGCHNPRLDFDNIFCDFSVTDPNDSQFCTPENVNIDFPPTNQWTRIAVHYYGNHDETYDVHPTVKVFCNGSLAANLGPGGFYMPESPVTFSSADGAGSSNEDNKFWQVADVAFGATTCGAATCTVKPIYADPTTKTPLFMKGSQALGTFGPAYPPPLP